MKNVLLNIPGGVPGVFVERPNRFLLVASLPSGKRVNVHVPDPGRLLELLYPGNRILILPASSRGRKTAWSLLGAWSENGWILVNTSFHRSLATEIFNSKFSPLGHIEELRAEVKSPLGGSRFDFLLNGNIWVEVKGCTLLRNGMAMFPDAPTSRGKKHVMELTEMSRRGMRTAVVFLVFVHGEGVFMANRETDPEFAEALRTAVSEGVEVRCVELAFDGLRVGYRGRIQFSQNP